MKKRPNLNVVCIVTHGADTRSIIARHDPIITDIITDNNQFLRCLGRATQRCRARSLHYSCSSGTAEVGRCFCVCWCCAGYSHNDNALLEMSTRKSQCIPLIQHSIGHWIPRNWSVTSCRRQCELRCGRWQAPPPDTITALCATLIFMDIKYGFGDQWSMTGPTNK